MTKVLDERTTILVVEDEESFVEALVVGLQREGTAAESEHSVDQRTSFAYVSWQMFRDHPVMGVGFGRSVRA